MSVDYNYWKKIYKSSWEASSSREQNIKKIIEKETGMEVEFTGIGAGTTDFISGKSAEKGIPDLHVVGTDIFIEVTGPLSKNVKNGAPLWFRPDKIKHVSDNCYNENIFFINHFSGDNTLHIIHFNSETMKYAKKSKEAKTDYTSREIYTQPGIKEKFVEVKSNTEYVSKDLKTLIDYINSYKEAIKNPDLENKMLKLRNSFNLTQKEFAKANKISLASLQDLEHGRKEISPEILKTFDKNLILLKASNKLNTLHDECVQAIEHERDLPQNERER